MNEWLAYIRPWLAVAEQYAQSAIRALDQVPRSTLYLVIIAAIFGWLKTYLKARKISKLLASEIEEVSIWRSRYEREKMWRDASAQASVSGSSLSATASSGVQV